MGWTKDEVDKYVAKVERNINTPREKNLKGFAFARLYKEARDNVKAKRHLEAYLSVNESDFRGHRMMGQLFEETGNLEKALLSYRRSLDLNNTQHDLVLKVVELYCQVPVDPGRARAWADRAARLYPGHPAVFKLRMHLLESVGKIDYEQMEDLISEELAKRPRDAKLHIRLIKVYSTTGRLVEAYSHCASVIRTKAFDDDTEWWMCAVDVFEKYMAGQEKMIPSDRDIGPGHVILDSHAHLMAALSQLLNIFLKTEKTRETINLLYRLDHSLTMAHERKVRTTARGSQSQKSEWHVVLTEMRGQLYIHCATLILKLAKENYLTWPRALKLASVCYTTCVQVQEPDITTPWVARAPKNKDALRWYHMACYRLSHAGHLLEAIIHKYGEEWLDNCISDWCTQQGQDEILNTVYGEHRDKSKSFLANDEEFFLLEINLPSVEQLVKYDEVCVGNNPRNLELITWIGLHWYHYERSIRPGVGVVVARIFDGLRMDVPNIEQTAADTLCLRDLEAFVYAVIRTSAAKFLEDQDLYIPDYQPQVLPQQLCDCLTSQAQEEWWLAAYNLYAGAASVSSAGRVRATVQRGLEVIRALGVHGLHIRLLIYLAFNFGDKASYLKTAGGVNPWYYQEHWKSLQARSLHYWKEALILLEKIERNENIPVRKDPLFPLLQNSLMTVDIKLNIQKARLILGEAALREGKIEEAMEVFEQVKTIQGMWNLAQIYKYLANVEAQAAASEDLDSDAQSSTPTQEYYNCLNKARELLLACMDKVPGEERRRQTLQDELNDIEDMLNEDPNRPQANPRKQLDFRQLDFQASRSSTMSDVQESEDNFWLEQPQDASSKDLIAKLSEVTLNNGYLQEQMAVRDQHLKELNSKVQLLETELRELKLRGFSGIMSPTNYPSPAPVPSITAQHNLPPFTSPVTHGPVSFETVSTTPTTSRQQTALNGRPLESTPVARPSVKSRLGPRIPVQTTPEPLKIDSNFFAGLSQTNSPETKSELDQSEEDETEQGSVRHDSTSFDDGIHFEPIIPLPQQIEKKTGEEGEIALFNKRAKLYRYDKDLKSWKERGTGTLKILSADGQTRFRILMRRDHILKICANHLITTEMELKPLKAGSQNSLVWTTAADFADETPNVEQLAVRFKLAEEATEFKVVFESCKNKLSGAPVTTSPTRLSTAEKDRGENNTDNNAAMPSTTDTYGTALSKFLPKAGTWECSNSFVDNEEKQGVAGSASRPGSEDSVLTETTISSFFTAQPLFQWSLSEKVKDLDSSSKGAPNVSFAPQNSAFNKPASDVSFGLPHGSVKQPSQEPEATQKFPFEFDPAPLQPEEPEEAIIKRGGMAQQPTPFSFSFKPSSTSSSSPLSFSFGKTQAPSFTLAPFGVSTTPSTSSQVTSSSTPVGFSFGPSSNETPKYERPQDKDDSKDTKPLTFTSSPSNALPGFDIDNDEEQENVSGDSANVSSEFSSASQQVVSASSSVPSTIPPQLFWQQQLEEKFKFGNLHRTEPLAGMAPVVVAPSSGKPDATYPASFLLSKLAGKSTSAPVSSQPVQGMGDSEANVPSLQQLKEKSLAHGAASQGAQRADLLMSLLQSKPRESSSQLQDLSNVSAVTPDDSSKTSEDLDDYSDDLETESEEESGSYHSSDDYNEDEDYSHSLEDDNNKTVVSQPSPTTHQLVPQGQSIMPKPPLMSISPAVSGRKFLTARSPLKKSHPKEDECVIIYEIRAAKTDRDKASRLLLPLNFFNHGRTDPCPGCLGCDENVRAKMKQDALKKSEKAVATPATPPKPKPEDSAIPAPKKESHIFGASLGDKPLSFASFSTTSGSSFGKKGTSHGSSAFPMAGQQLFGSPAEDEADEADIYFKPLIPLPELIKVSTGEEDHTMLFSERARLYRFDASSSMWKERGIGDIKLLLDNKTGRGRVVMRREQVHKLCANHWITEDMELRTNSTSDRSWVWQTLADFSEETPSQEKLAVRFKQPDTALKFKDQFDDLVALARKKSAESKAAGKTSENSSEQPRDSPTSSSAVTIFETPNKDQRSEEVDGTDSLIDKFKPKQGTWECSVCMVQNNSGTTACVACTTPKSGQTSEPASVQAQKFTFGPSSQGTGFSIPTAFKFGNYQPQQPGQPGGIGQSKASVKPLFTIGRGDAPEEELDEETSFRHYSPSKISPSKSPSKTSPSSTVPPSSGTPVKPLTGFAFGSLSHTKFNFKLELTPDKGPSVRAPQSPTSPESPGSHPEAEDDGIHFEPIIPLPKKIAKKTGEENEEVLFCHRAKLYRFDHEGNLWKERGIGDMKILRSTSSGKCRIVMRREIVLKLCTNHQVTPEMTLKPNAGSEKSWVWNTFADFADEVAKQETLAVRFKTSEVAQSFKDAFEKAKESKVQTEVSETEGEDEGKQAPLEDDSTYAQESEEIPSKQSTEDQKLQKSPAVEKDENRPKDEKDESETKKEDAQPSGFLFGSSSISSLSFASVASCIESGPGLLVSTKGSQGFKPGPALFSRSPPQQRESEESEGEESHEHDDGPHFEPLVPLPEKVEVRTGEEEEEIIFSHRAKLYRFDCHLKQWKERGVGDIKILFHKKNGRVRILMRRDHVLKICANHYVTPEMNLNPNGSSTKSWVWNTLADFSDEEVKAEQLAVRFKLDETAREFKEKFDKCKEKMLQQASEVSDQSKTTTEDNLQKDIADTEGETNKEVEEKSPGIVDETDSIIDKFKPKPGAWECEACLIQNNPGTTACVACNTPKPGHKSEPAANIQALQTFSFGASPQGTNLSKPAGKSDGDEAVSSSQSTPAFGFGGLSFGLPSKDVPSQKPPFTFGSTSVPEDTTASEPSSTHVSEDATDSATAHETKQDSLMDKFKVKPGTWDCETCLVPNDADSTTCVACSSPKPGVDQTQAALSTQRVSAFGLGGPPKPTGFSFGLNGNSAPITFGFISFGLPSKDTQSQTPQSVLGNASEPKEDTTASEPSSTHVSEDATDSATTQDPTQAASSIQSAPAFGLGGPKPTGFSFGQNDNSAPITFGGISFGLPSKDLQDHTPQSVLGNASEPKEDTTASEPSSTHVSEDATDSVTAQDPTQAASSTQSASAFGFGGPKPTGFSFGQNANSVPETSGGFSFRLPSKDAQSQKPQSVLGNASEPKEDTTASEPSSTHVSEDATDSATAQETKQDSLMDKFKAKSGTWDCETCLVPNDADSTKCVACSSPRPGVDTTQAALSTQSAPAFGLGGPKPTGFSFGQSTSSAPVTFGGFSFGLRSKDNQSQEPQSAFGNADIPKEGTTVSKASATSIFGVTTDTSKTAGTSKVPEFTFGAPNVGQSCKDKDIEPVREAVIQPEEEDKAEAVATDATESRKPDVIDLTLTNVVEPSEEEKRRAQSLLLPEGFFLYQRQPQTPSSVSRAKEKSPNRVPVENKTAVQKEAKKTEEPKSVFGSSSALSFSSFSDVSIDKGFQFGGQKSSKGFAGQGTQLFSSTHGTDDGVEEERDIYFKPLVSLSEIEVVTGEENEEKLFSHRAKLYRFESSVSQWKERGVGEIKILKNKNSKKFRIVMRRDQIHKLCANHIITTDMNLVPNAGSERSWVWHTLADLSEEEPRGEQLAVRFKSPETAKEFKKVFEECKAILSEQNQGDASVSEVDSSSIETVTDNEVVKLEPATTFGNESQVLSVTADNTTHSSDGEDKEQLLVSNSSKEKEDGTAGVGSSDDASWECRSCHVSNDSLSNTYKECSTPREESNEGIYLQENLDTTERQETPEPDSTVSEDKDSPKPSQPEFLFGTKSLSSLSFSDAGKVGIFGQTSSSSSSSSETFSFKGLNDQKPVEDKPEDDDQDDGYHDTSGDYIHFEPIIELPDKIETVTGEENEEVVFKQRAKLFRFDKEVKQWKERGVGEMKILTGKGQSRIVMRREHIHKLCANHLITIDMTLKANNSEKSWMWQTLADVSEEEPKEELLAVRFKTPEIAQEFKTKFDECRDTSDPPDKSLSVGVPNESPGESSDKEEPSVKEEAEGVSEGASENIQEMPSSSTSPSRQDVMPSNSTQLVAGGQFHSFRTVKKEVKQSSNITTSSHRIEQSAVAKLYREEKVVQSGNTKTEESQQIASLALQEKEITSSGEEKAFMPSFSPETRAMMQPSIFNQQLMSRQGQSGIFNQEWMFRQGPGLFGRQPVFQTPSLESTSQMFSAQSLIDQPTSSQSPGNASVTKTGPRDLRQTETRTVEVTQQLSSSVVTSSDRKTVSCSPEITKMLEEIEDEDKDKSTKK